MELNEKLEMLAELLDRDAGELTATTPLDTLGWDSMGMLSVIALAKTNGKTITGDTVRGFKTVGDLVAAAF